MQANLRHEVELFQARFLCSERAREGRLIIAHQVRSRDSKEVSIGVV